MEVLKNFIGGRWKAADSGRIRTIICPSDGKAYTCATESGRKDAEAAIEAAKKSFYEERIWRDMSAPDRTSCLLKIAELIRKNADELAEVDAQNTGKPLREAQGDVSDAAECFQYYAGLTDKPLGSVYSVGEEFGKMQTFTVYEPLGVCAQIAPWNYPILMAAWKLAPALAAGNSVVFKPSEHTPVSTVKLFRIFEQAGLPAGTANLVLGDGPGVGTVLAESKDVDMISFTGSTRTGQFIAKAATDNLKKVSLELGGKSPLIIFSDCHLEAAVEWALMGIFFNAGQVCASTSRLLVEESIKDQFVECLVKRAQALTIGHSMDNPDIGAIITEAQMNKILAYIEAGKKEGAKLMCGGERYMKGKCASGFFITPAIFDNCTSDMKIVKEEIFGPVLSVLTFRTEKEAVALANDTEYGLAGGVITKDGSKALRVMRELRAGITWINCSQPAFCQAPWGGYKKSGIGRELGVNGLEEYQELKQVNINLDPEIPPDWFSN